MSDSRTSWRILVIDDNPDIHKDIQKCLGVSKNSKSLLSLEREFFGKANEDAQAPEYEIVSADQGESGVLKCTEAIARGERFSAAFVDMRMPPGIDGLETIDRLWKVDPGLQVVLCTAFSDYSWKQISGRLGRRDNLLVLRKPFEQIEVQQMVLALCEKRRLELEAQNRVIELEKTVHERTAELREAQKQDRMRLESLEEIVDRRTAELRRAALHDRLTSLPNRGHFADAVNDAIRRAAQDPRYDFAVLFLDCDRFKVVNDSLGHHSGDELLIELAQRLSSACHSDPEVRERCEKAVPARLGGDEFAILLSGLKSPDSPALAAKRILEMLGKPACIQGHELKLEASIGIATSAQRYSSAEDVIRDADTAMYKAKSGGRNRFVSFTPRMHADAMQRLMLENDLRAAIQGGKMDVHYQPIIDLATGEIVALEALSRWTHPEFGPLPPAHYIPLAEETGLIVPLGDQVLIEGFTRLAGWSKVLPRALVPVVSLNVSRKQLVDAHFAERLEELVKSTGVDPSKIVLEITESTVMEHMDFTLDVLGRCRKLGLGIYMDDFGTGHSSLSCLQHFPLTGLKIDRSFTGGERKEPYRTSLVQAIITVAHNMRIPAIAEGIETVEDVAWLQTLGCDRGQGFFFATATPPESVFEMLQTPSSWASFPGVQSIIARRPSGNPRASASA